jgi:glucose/arabinose dehydrogenase
VHAPQYVEPVTWWPGPGNTPPYYSIAPAGIAFYNGSGFPEWQGNLFVAALNTGGSGNPGLWRLTLSGNTVTAREQLFNSLGERFRTVRQGPDGWLYVLTDQGRIYRIDR